MVFSMKKDIFLPARWPRFELDGLVSGVSVCEDIWHKEGPSRLLAANGAGLIFNINASPYHAGKIVLREKAVKERIEENHAYVCYVNLVGGQDEMVFDGQSFIMDKKGHVIARGEAFKEDLLIVDIPVSELRRRKKKRELHIWMQKGTYCSRRAKRDHRRRKNTFHYGKSEN